MFEGGEEGDLERKSRVENILESGLNNRILNI